MLGEELGERGLPDHRERRRQGRCRSPTGRPSGRSPRTNSSAFSSSTSSISSRTASTSASSASLRADGAAGLGHPPARRRAAPSGARWTGSCRPPHRVTPDSSADPRARHAHPPRGAVAYRTTAHPCPPSAATSSATPSTDAQELPDVRLRPPQRLQDRDPLQRRLARDVEDDRVPRCGDDASPYRRTHSPRNHARVSVGGSMTARATSSSWSSAQGAPPLQPPREPLSGRGPPTGCRSPPAAEPTSPGRPGPGSPRAGVSLATQSSRRPGTWGRRPSRVSTSDQRSSTSAVAVQRRHSRAAVARTARGRPTASPGR